MKLQDVIDLAKSGELKQLSVKDDSADVIGFVNLGLIELYKRFKLRTEEYMIALQEGVTIYTMPVDFMNIIAAYDEVPEGVDDLIVPIPVNMENDPFSINTVSYNQIQIPVTTNGAYISIIYSVKPTYLTVMDLEEELPIPDSLVEALLHYIGYRGHGSVDGNIQSENNTHYQRFERSCLKAEQLGVVIAHDGLDMTLRFKDRGFV